MSKLKYEDTAGVGDRIRSYDFQGRTDCYIEGVVQRIDREGNENGYAAFVVKVDRDIWNGSDTVHRVDWIMYVPMQLAFMEYEGRIVNLSATPTK